ncbi:N-acetylmuramidase domain-containing protein [Escherichia coli]
MQYAKVRKAYTCDKKQLWRLGVHQDPQILASNYATAGYASPEDFVFAYKLKSEKNQLKAFVSFIKADRVLLHSIRAKDWLHLLKDITDQGRKDMI